MNRFKVNGPRHRFCGQPMAAVRFYRLRHEQWESLRLVFASPPLNMAKMPTNLAMYEVLRAPGYNRIGPWNVSSMGMQSDWQDEHGTVPFLLHEGCGAALWEGEKDMINELAIKDTHTVFQGIWPPGTYPNFNNGDHWNLTLDRRR